MFVVWKPYVTKVGSRWLLKVTVTIGLKGTSEVLVVVVGSGARAFRAVMLWRLT